MGKEEYIFHKLSGVFKDFAHSVYADRKLIISGGTTGVKTDKGTSKVQEFTFRVDE